MRKTFFVPALLLLSLTFQKAAAQNCDPWIVEIYNKLYTRNPTAEECKISNYNKGQWGSKQELEGYIKQYKAIGTGEKINLRWTYTPSPVSGDQWIGELYQKLYNRAPNAWEYNINNYNNGKWGSKDELQNLITQYQENTRKAGMSIDLYDLGNGRFVVDLKLNGKSTAVDLIDGRGGNVVAAGGANVVSAGGANVVASGGANVVSPGGGNIVQTLGGNVISPGGGNVAVNKQAPGFMPGTMYQLQSGNNRSIKTSGGGAIVIR